MSSAAAERENRALESATESIIMRLADIKTSLGTLCWTYLDLIHISKTYILKYVLHHTNIILPQCLKLIYMGLLLLLALQ